MSTITEMVAPFTKVPNINQTATFESDTSVFLNEINARYVQGNTQVEQINIVAGELNVINGNVNTTYDNTIIAKNATEGFKNEAEEARDEAVGAVASLPIGTLNDSIKTLTNTWSSEKIDNEKFSKSGGNISGAISYNKSTFTTTLDCSIGNVFSQTVTTDRTISIGNAEAGKAFVIVLLLEDGGSSIITWDTDITWVDGTAPELSATGLDMVTLITLDGTDWYGTYNIGFA